MESSGPDFQWMALIGGLFVAGFIAVWVFMTLRQSGRRDGNRGEDRND